VAKARIACCHTADVRIARLVHGYSQTLIRSSAPGIGRPKKGAAARKFGNENIVTAAAGQRRGTECGRAAELARNVNRARGMARNSVADIVIAAAGAGGPLPLA